MPPPVLLSFATSYPVGYSFFLEPLVLERLPGLVPALPCTSRMTFNVVPGSLSFSSFTEVSGQYHLMLGGTCHRAFVSRLTHGGPVVAACAVIVVSHLHLHSFSPPLSLNVLSEAPLLSLTCPSSEMSTRNLKGALLGPLLPWKLLCR